MDMWHVGGTEWVGGTGGWATEHILHRKGEGEGNNLLAPVGI